MDASQTQNSTISYRIWYFAIGISFLVTAVQFFAAWRAGSIAVWADAAEGVLNVVTSLLGLTLARFANRPADSRHPYGHGRLEFVGMLIEGVLVAVIAIEVARSGISRLQGQSSYYLATPVMVLYAFTILLNGYGAYRLARYGREQGSGLARAEAVHLRTDALTTLVIVISLLAGQSQGWFWLDPVLALIIALQILWSGWELVRDGANVLMDEALPEAEDRALRALLAAQVAGPVKGFHAVKTRRIGTRIGVNFHLVVDGELTVQRGHEVAHNVEDNVHERYPDAFVTVHIEPAGLGHPEGADLDPEAPLHDPRDDTL